MKSTSPAVPIAPALVSAMLLMSSAVGRAQDLPGDLFFEPDRPAQLECKFLPSGHLLVRPLLDDEETSWWVLDSGAGRSCIDPEVADELGLEAYGQVQLKGVGGTEAGRFRRADIFRLGAMVIDAPTFVEMQCDFLSKHFGHEIAGIAGFDVFSRAVVSIDRQLQQIALYDPATVALPEGTAWNSLEIHGGHPCVMARFEGDREGLFTLDTGAGNQTVTFHRPAVESLGLLEGREVTESTAGGVGGSTRTLKGRLEYFEIGGRRFDHPEVEFATENVGAFDASHSLGNLGGHFLAPFTVLFDYQNRRIAFVPRALEGDG